MLILAFSVAASLTLGSAPDTTAYEVLNHGRHAGDMIVVRQADTVHVRYIYRDRNRGTRREVLYHMTPDEGVAGATSAVVNAEGQARDPDERFVVEGDRVRWTRNGRADSASAQNGALYDLGGGTPFDRAALARSLLRHPDGRAPLLPSGEARARVAADTVLAAGDDGRLRFVLVRETTGSEAQGRWTDEWGVWLDAEGRLVATDAGWFITVLEGRQALLPALRAMETRVREVRAQELEQAVRQPVAGPLVIAGGDVFDSESGTVLPDMTVVVEDDRITRVVPASDYQAPAEATVVDARGRTVLPGLWDMHVHLNFGSQTVGMVTKLAAGVTSARDMASDLDVALSHRRRADQGTIASPRMLLAGFMEGPGAWAGPTEVLVRDEAEALRWVARYDSLGYRQIKLYNLIHPDLVPTISREAHRRGMRLSGHIPRGLSLEAAVELGYDEVNHAAFLFSTFFPDSLFVPTMRPYSGVASAVAGDFDVDGPAMTGLLEFLKDHGTVVDGTFAIWEGWGMLDGQGPPSAHAYERLLRRLFEEGVTLVPGTDAASGTQLLVELELYEHAGIPAPEVLRIATLIPATVMGEAADYGSVTAGKIADLVIVDGRPAEHIRDLRQAEYVVRAGRLYRSDDLYRAAGVVPPPHP